MKLTSFLIIILFAVNSALAQIEFGLDASIGIGSIKKHTTASNIDFAPQLSPAFQFGTFVNYPVFCSLNLGSELNFSHYSDIEHIRYQSAFVPGKSEHKISSSVKQKLSAISIPVFLSFSHHKMNFIVGPQFSFITSYTNTEKTEYNDINGNRYHTELKENIKHHDMDYGFIIGMHYDIESKWAASIRFYQSLRSSFESSDPLIPTIGPNSFSLGIRYSIN